MWKNWKKKVTDFIFEEIEEDLVIEQEDREKPFNKRQINAQVTYQYPNQTEVPFRFPLIPDETTREPEEVSTSEKRSSSKRKYRSRTGRALPESYTSVYHEKQKQKELENIPAFMRRRREQDVALEELLQHEQEENEPYTTYTTPAELDAVFKRKSSLDTERVQRTDRQRAREEKALLEEYSTNVAGTRNMTTHQEVEMEQAMQLSQTRKKPFVQALEQTNLNRKVSFAEQAATRIAAKQYEREVPLHLLNDPLTKKQNDSTWLVKQQQLLKDTLKHFQIEAQIVAVTQGPAVTRIEIQPALGVKVSKIRNLADDIKLNLAAKDVRIEAPIPGKNTVGIEIPNKTPQMVQLKDMLESPAFQQATSPLAVALGMTIEGQPYITDIAKMPHCLIAGATGSGKSVCINAILLSLLYKASYEDVKFIMIDPKMVELTPYNGIPHLIAPVITDPKAAMMALKWAVDEMEKRYSRFVELGVRNIEKYNEKVVHSQDENMPYIVIIIDELADLMIVSPQEVEDAICRIAQKARAAGIHLLLATQRPSVDVITGLIKANVPTRIAFSVSSQVDSRTILDTNGAEKLLGKGDMLFLGNGMNKSLRLQGPFVADEEIDRVCHYLRQVAEPNYLFQQEELLITAHDEAEDELLDEVIAFVVETQKASTSLLQRRFRIGYNRAARLIDTLYERGIISAQNGSKPRDVLLSKSEWDKLNNND